MQIKPVAQTYREISKASFFKIPPFQRPYSWNSDNNEEFWTDLINIEGGEYFLGSVVFYADAKDAVCYFITDGQQRITTINILLCVIRDYFSELGDEGLASGTHGFIEKADEDNVNRFTVKYGSDNEYLASGILNLDKAEVKPKTTEEKNQKNAYDFFSKKVGDYLAVTIGAGWKTASKSSDLLKVLRGNLLNMQFIVLTLDNEDDAFLIFETLNTRGKDLEVSDLIKNHLSKLIKNKNKDLPTVSREWQKISYNFDNLHNKADFDTFLTHYWLSVEKYVSKKVLFGEFKKKVSSKNAKERLKDIKLASDSYCAILDTSHVVWKAGEYRSIRRSLDALAIFSVAQARPLMLAAVRKHLETDFVKLKQLSKLLTLIENFTFQFNAITQSRGGGGIAGMYASLAQHISQTNSAQDFADGIKVVREKFLEREISESEFSYNFQELHYSENNSRDSKLVRYVLSKFRETLKPSAEDFDQYNIEHLVSQKLARDGVEDWDLVGNIGNLIFVPEALNSKLDSKDSYQKLEVLDDEGFIDATFGDDWHQSTKIDLIVERALTMADIAQHKIWKI